MLPEKAFYSSSTWSKLRYKIKKVEGMPVIAPVSIHEKVKRYRPLDHEPPRERLKWPEKHKDLSPVVALARLDLTSNEDIMDFTNRWGLLGLWNAPGYRDGNDLPPKEKLINNWSKECSAWFINPEYIKDKELSELDETIADDIELSNEAYDTEPVDAETTPVNEDTPVISQFLKWQEPLSLFIEAAEDLKELFKLINSYHEKKEETGLEQLIMLHLNEQLKEVRVGIDWNEGKKEWRAVWQFNSLLGAIYLQTFLFLQENRLFYRCRYCKKLYIAGIRGNNFCSDDCQNIFEVQRTRKKQYKEKLTRLLSDKYPSIDLQWLNLQIELFLEKPGIAVKRAAKEIEKKWSQKEN